MIEDDYRPGSKSGRDTDRMIVISGCSGGGKSTLMAELAQRGYATFAEPGRQIVREQQLIGGTSVPWDDMAGFLEQCVIRAIHFHTLAQPNAGPVFFDRSMIDAVTAAETTKSPVPSCYYRAIDRCRYAPVVFLAPPWEELFLSDRERQHGFEAAVGEYERLAEAYPHHGYLPVILPKIRVTERADFIEQELKRRRLWPAAV